MAMAPEQTGIGIRRHFTTEGIHPYDEVAWERRDARITNYRDGVVAFEQLGVEFPASWSLNAANIVTQKYFRGPLGSPQREQSLRQVIDRVADTITAWGTKDGYFVDDAEAEAFRAELKHLVVHQKAAFNSPVWFNIGVKGEPQQASACFILAVDDTMKSILNWYVEEGTIFKGGSGSGINLSNIRSSYEQLKGGGTASGPVSFMRGADASAGTIKCLHADTPIVTGRGVMAIKDARRGDQVLTRFGYREIDAVHDNGVRPLVRVRTSFGDEILCTPEHRFHVRNPGGEEWREAGSLRPEDHVLIHVAGGDDGRLQALAPVAPGYHTEVVHELPTQLDESMAMWLGWIYGDGSITSRAGAKFVAVQIGDADPDLVDRYCALTRGVFGSNVHFYVDRHKDKVDASASVRFASAEVIRFLEANGLRKDRCAHLRVPSLIQASPATVRAAFLSGLFEADGHLGNGYAWLSTVSEVLAQDVHRLLLSIGIPSKIGRIDDRREAHGTLPVYTVRVVGSEGMRRFAKQVGFVSDSKHHRLEAAVIRKDASPYETQWFLPHVAVELCAVWAATTNQSLRRALSPYCRYARPRRMSLLRARALLDRFPDELGHTTLARFAYGDELWASVEVEQAGEGPTFDLTVDGVHEYLVNNVVTHNSGGKTRRAAKMVILNADHPDIEDFIWCKAIEERKARVLRDAGFDMDLDGKDSHSTQYQNANNSVRVTDEFMQAVLDDADWHLRAVTTGEPVRTVKARQLFRQIAEATWECADPGMQFDTTINRWHTAANTGRINGSNPCCFTGETLVETSAGLVPFELLHKTSDAGLELPDVTSYDVDAGEIVTRPIRRVWVAGYTDELVEVRTERGLVLRCTPEHRFLTTTHSWVEAHHLAIGERLRTLGLLEVEPGDVVASVERVVLPEPVAVYDLEVDGTHNFAVSCDTSQGEHSVIVHNSEYMHLDNSACNLASLNLLKFLDETGTFDVEGFKAAVEVVFTAQEILVGNADYPTEKIGENARRFRQLGLGYANLGAMLMALGIAYDSDDGRTWAAGITSLMTGHAYATSARTAARMGPFAGYSENREPMNKVLRMHRDEAAKLEPVPGTGELVSAAQEVWDRAVEWADDWGTRNSQATVLAPTGTIGLMMDCDTTGIEPDLGLCKTKKLVGGGTMSIVNQTVPRALRRLGYSPRQVDDIVAYIDQHKSILGAPHISADHLSVFACSMGDNVIHYLGHVRMMAAVQPWISGAISKTINMPEEATVEDMEQLHIDAWRMGLKAVAVYRDNCKVAQPLSTTKKEAAPVVQPVLVKQPVRERLPRMRNSKTFSFRVADCHGYVTVGEYDDGRPGEIFLRVAKQGSTLAGIMDAFAISVSHGLQYGVPLRAFVDMYTNMRFEPAGITDDAEIRFASSLVDYIFRRLAVEYLTPEDRAELGILTVEERMQPTLPGVEESATPTSTGTEVVPDPAPAQAVLATAPPAASDAPYCYQCGVVMQRAGACFVCTGCGTTSGCS
jgi:ribonucleotide reductase alpha subunit